MTPKYRYLMYTNHISAKENDISRVYLQMASQIVNLGKAWDS